MAHMIDNTAGKNAVAFTGETPWHGLGQKLTPGAALELWQQEAGLDWEAKRARVLFAANMVGADGEVHPERREMNSDVIYRSDTGAGLGIVSQRYKIVQPKEVIEFYRDLTKKFGFEMETAGAIRDGKQIWALANTKQAMQLKGRDENRLYLLLATSFDGTMATQCRLTDIRVVCNNTLSLATEESSKGQRTHAITVPHHSKFDADAIKEEMQIGEAWEAFCKNSKAMASRPVDKKESTGFLFDVYYGAGTEEEFEALKEAKGEKLLNSFKDRMQQALFNSPGAHLASAQGMLWGLVNAVTYDIDHTAPTRGSNDSRLSKAWFGHGETIKNRAWSKALEMLEA